MSEQLAFTVAPTINAPLAGIKRAESAAILDPAKCEIYLNIGVFFDGTNNNRDADTADCKHTNVVRLWDAYRDKPADGYFPIYIPGVGTEFVDLREHGISKLGAGFGIGCEGRVLYTLLAVFNAIHRAACNGQPLISKTQMSALCCNSANPASTADRDELAKLGLASGLLMSGSDVAAGRERIFLALTALLQRRLVTARPCIRECFIDVFGFSRGAAQARVFCAWLEQAMTGGCLAGVRMHFRFLGIMETVASAGFWASLSDSGHGGWANPAHLRISQSIINCVHMVAMHELRKNFPLDTVTVNGITPSNCREFAYPGVHSDVGGGYLPAALGVSVGRSTYESDALKLAQIPLNHMFDCAVRAGVPLSKKRASEGDLASYDSFAIAPALQAAYDEFLDLSTMAARPVKDWMQPYLNWRWDRRLVYSSLGHVRKANEADRALLIKYNNIYIADAAVVQRKAKSNSSNSVVRLFGAISQRGDARHVDLARQCNFEGDANTILEIAQRTTPDEAMKFHTMFDGFVHDSLAGFDMHSVEMSGHWRYRKGFHGSGTPHVVDIDNAAKVARTG
jgi:hypothetical protein